MGETIKKEENTSQSEYDVLMSQLFQKIKQVSQSQVEAGIAIGRLQQKEADSKAALKSASTMWNTSEHRLEKFMGKCEREVAAFRAQQNEWESRIRVLESSLGVTASEATIEASPLPHLQPLL